MYGDAKVELENNSLKITLLPTAKVFTSSMEHWQNNTFKVVFKDPYLPFGLINFSLDNQSKKVNGFTIDLPSSDFNFSILDFKKVD